MTDSAGSEFNIINYMKVFFRRKEILIICGFFGLVLGVSAGFLLPKAYESLSVILVQEGKTDNPLFEHLAVSTTVGQRMAGIKESILGWNSMVELVKRLSLDRDVKTAFEYEELIMNLRRNILIKLHGHNIIYLSYIGRIPEQTQAIVETITSIFIDRNVKMQNQETTDAITFIQEQLHVYKGKIKSAEIAELEDQLNTLLVDSTEKHPMVRKYREMIQQKREELRKENLEYTPDVDLSPQKTNPIIDEIRRALSSLEKSEGDIKLSGSGGSPEDIYRAMLMARLDNVAARDVKVNEQIYNMLLQRLETAKITQRLQSSKEGTRYEIIDPPRIPLKPFKPNRGLVALFGLFMGTVAGFGLVLGSEFFDKSFIDVEEAKEYLGVALFGAISKISTPESIRREKEKKRWLYGLTFVVGAVLVIATVNLAAYLK